MRCGTHENWVISDENWMMKVNNNWWVMKTPSTKQSLVHQIRTWTTVHLKNYTLNQPL